LASSAAKALKLEGENIIYSDDGGFDLDDIIGRIGKK